MKASKKDEKARAGIAEKVYEPTHNLLGENPYNVPKPIRPTFTAMKIPEVVAYIVDDQG